MDLHTSMQLAFAGMTAQGQRLKVIAQNLANTDSTAKTAGGEPYRRKIVTFHAVLDKTLGADSVAVGRPVTVSGTLERKYDPGNPAADTEGYVQMPNVNPVVELMDMRDAQQSYQANLNVIDAAKSMISHTLDLLRG
ncbi:MAG TPA: flagellar basal body rod protein FlgC [Stellaceae bacterium]|jgi:flagellar basal-body rod protein FlgC|nr:flagellar basal body rod protein FlgC [Stellaceae bacterium]